MKIERITRRDVSLRIFSGLTLLGVAGTSLAFSDVPDAKDDGISRDAEAIHQEPIVKASPARVYSALTDAKQFRIVTDAVMPNASANISPEVGGTFSIFNGIISGRHVEMVPGERLVQAWREKDWEAGLYSLVRFQLKAEGGSTRIIFDHTGFPKGNAYHLAPGWKSHYWVPLQKYFAVAPA